MHKSLFPAVMWFLVVFGAFSFLFKVVTEWRKGTRIARIALFLPALAVVCMVSVWWAVRIPVYGPFKRARQEYPALGNPTGKATGEVTNLFWHERALLIWMSEKRSFFAITNSPGGLQGWIEIGDVGYDEDYLYDLVDIEELAVRHQQVPPNLGPPWGGIANIFFNQIPPNESKPNVQYWIDRFGFRINDCAIPQKDSVHLQQFENGWILGPVRQYQWDSKGNYWVLIKEKDGNARAIQIEAPPVDCGNINHHSNVWPSTRTHQVLKKKDKDDET